MWDPICDLDTNAARTTSLKASLRPAILENEAACKLGQAPVTPAASFNER
jgi:hypothetical protein